jgi:tRNA A37 threonylcarbamoyladenosine modification protein TsaB
MSKKKLHLGIDSSLSLCSITVFTDKKIIWHKEKKCDFGHEKYLPVLLQKLVRELRCTPDQFISVYLNNGPARYTCIRSCHALVKGYFLFHDVRYQSCNIYQHFLLGEKQIMPQARIACALDTNRRDIAIQEITSKGKLKGSMKTFKLEPTLIEHLRSFDLIIGNSKKKIRDRFPEDAKNVPFSRNQKVSSEFFKNAKASLKTTKTIPRIIYPYSPV